ncbi:hypothetical protein F2P81_020080 [Scophthalmus maximus]|uniref:Uncharacterized protein n=1 Tax=Scophthalmus maximus TaxID=52904 RepID=A0A6A4S4A6_SCOMX|nr:hypothetical protein F2P81_020080 [Scophthalmus maximus]
MGNISASRTHTHTHTEINAYMLFWNTVGDTVRIVVGAQRSRGGCVTKVRLNINNAEAFEAALASVNSEQVG